MSRWRAVLSSAAVAEVVVDDPEPVEGDRAPEAGGADRTDAEGVAAEVDPVAVG